MGRYLNIFEGLGPFEERHGEPSDKFAKEPGSNKQLPEGTKKKDLKKYDTKYRFFGRNKRTWPNRGELN